MVIISKLVTTILLGGLALMMMPQVSADEPGDSAPDRLLSGRPFQTAIEQRRSLRSAGLSVRETFSDLQQASGIAIVLDRRINPSRRIDVETGYVPTRNVFEVLAQSASASVSVNERYIFIGPAAAADRLQTLTAINSQHVQTLRRKTDPDVYRRLVQPVDLSWPMLSEPRQLLLNAAQTAGITVHNPDQIPHDLWAAVKLPALPFSDFATLVLNQFDLTFEIADDGTMNLIPITPPVMIERRHRIASKDRQSIAARWKNAYPQLVIAWRGSTATVSATVEVHEQLEAMSRGESDSTHAVAGVQDRQFTMKVSAGTSFGQLIAAFRSNDVPIRIEGRSESELNDLLQSTVEFDLKGVPGTEFFRQVFGPSGAKITVTDDEVILTFSDAERE